MRQVIVFAYGSNLDDQQMRSRCASARIEARAVLPNHALAFGGFSQRWGGAVASVVPEPGARVEGLLYRITSPDLRALDRHEGFPFAYERISKLVTDERGRRRRAQVYRHLRAVAPAAGVLPGAPARVRPPGLRPRAAGGGVVTARNAPRGARQREASGRRRRGGRHLASGRFPSA